MQLANLVLDYNGTIAFDGELIAGVPEALRRLSTRLQIHVLTADTFGTVQQRLAGLPCRLAVLGQEAQDLAKRDYVKTLRPERTVSIGNGRNDRFMLADSALGLAVVQQEGAFAQTLQAADIVCSHILDALALLEHPLRLTATLRA